MLSTARPLAAARRIPTISSARRRAPGLAPAAPRPRASPPRPAGTAPPAPGETAAPQTTPGGAATRRPVALLGGGGVGGASAPQDPRGRGGRGGRDVAMMRGVGGVPAPADPDSVDSDANKTDYVKGLTT